MSSTDTTPFPSKHRQARVFRNPGAPAEDSAIHGDNDNHHHNLLQNALTHETTKVNTRIKDRYSAGIKIDWVNLTDSKATLPIQITLDQVQQYFRDNNTEKYAAVLEEGKIVGLCSELSITRKLTVSRGLGYHVYAKTHLDRHLEPTFLLIERGAPVRDVLYKVMSRKEGFFDDVILTDQEGKFLGLIRTQSMMLLQHRISQQQVEDLEGLTLKLNDNNVELERARDVAMQAAEMKSTFLANMSHEIRTPLNGILGMVKILMRTELAAQQRRYASTVLNSANALLTILNDILDFSKIEAGKMTFEQVPFDLSDLIEESVQLLSERAREKKIEIISWIDLKANTRIICDSSRLRQVILNLASNAVKFTEKGEVVVRIDQEKETESHVTLKVSIKDTGIGITPETRDRLFRPFEQGDRSTNRKFGGTGLGLAISKKIIDLMGGTIGCDSELGKGSTFWFRLELPKQPALTETTLRREDDLWGLRILIVDGSTTFGSYLDQHMAKWKVVSRVCQNSATALEIARSQADRGTLFDIVIVDYHIQPMDGVELARQFQADPRLARSRFIILSSFENEVSADQLRSISVAGTMSKPLKPSELYDTLANTIRQRSIQDANPAPTLAPEARIEASPSSVSIPAPTPAPAPAPPAPAPQLKEGAIRLATSAQERACPPLNLLLVEDSEVNREVALILLESWGHTLETAENGRVAVEMLKSKRYDGILMDCQMPEMDGYEATKWIRDPSSQVLQHDIQIVAMTANAMPGDRETCLRAGMNDYVGKPIDEAELLQALLRVAATKTRSAAPSPAPLPLPIQPAHPPSPQPPSTVPAIKAPALPAAATLDVPRFEPELSENGLPEASTLAAPAFLPVQPLAVTSFPAPAVPAPPVESDYITSEPPRETLASPVTASYIEPVAAEEDDDDQPYFPARLISLFLNETESRLAELRESLQREDIVVIQRISHTIKGTAGNFRANRLYEITREIEKLSRDNQIQAIWPLMAQADEAFKTVKIKYLNSVAYQPSEKIV